MALVSQRIETLKLKISEVRARIRAIDRIGVIGWDRIRLRDRIIVRVRVRVSVRIRGCLIALLLQRIETLKQKLMR
jgi:hypothetical protein